MVTGVMEITGGCKPWKKATREIEIVRTALFGNGPDLTTGQCKFPGDLTKMDISGLIIGHYDQQFLRLIVERLLHLFWFGFKNNDINECSLFRSSIR